MTYHIESDATTDRGTPVAPVARPPVQPCCGKRHPERWLHKGEIFCGVCGKVSRPAARGSICCKDCLPIFKARLEGPFPDDGTDPLAGLR